MPEPYLSLCREQRANYYSLLPEHRPLVDKAYGVFEDFVRTSDLESLEKRVFPIYQEYERLAASIGPSKPEPYYRLRDSFGAGQCGLAGLAAWIFDAYMGWGRRDKAWDFLCAQRAKDCPSPRRARSISEIVNLRLLSPDRAVKAEEFPSSYPAGKPKASAPRREAVERAADELIARFESARGFSFTGYFFTRWLLRDADAYAPFSDVVRAATAKKQGCKDEELAEADIRHLMNVREEDILSFNYAFSGYEAGKSYSWYESPEFDAVFSIIIDSLMVLAESELGHGGDGFLPDAEPLSAYPGPFDFQDRRAYSWTEDEILSEVSSYVTIPGYDAIQVILSRLGAFSYDAAQRETSGILCRLIEAHNVRALSNLLSTGSADSPDDFSELLSCASKVDAGAEILSVILSSQHQFCQVEGLRGPGAIPEL